MRNKYLFLALLGAFLTFFIGSCKDDDKGTNPGNDDNTTTVTTTITGTVVDEFEVPISGATVKVGTETKTTNSDGVFTFSGVTVPKNRYCVVAEKSGYFENAKSDIPKAGGTQDVKIILLTSDASGTVSSSSGGTINASNGTAVQLTANSVAREDGSAYSGNVNIDLAYLDPTAENFSEIIPGGDLRAQRTDNSEVSLYSYGIIKVEMTDDGGTELAIKPGNKSKITVDIPASMVADAPATIPLWHFDKAKGIWVEEGTATKQGDKYVGEVGHFSDWNCDVPTGTGTIKGLVLDCNNEPVQGLTIQTGQSSVTTGADGRFERRVPTGVSFSVQVSSRSNWGISSTPLNVTALTEGQVKDLGTIRVDCPAYVKGTVQCNNQPLVGQVVVSWVGGYNAEYTDGSGNFKIPVDVAKSAKLSIYTFNNRYKTMDITTPSSRGQTLNLNVITVCEEGATGENSFIVNGDGYNNQKFTFGGEVQQAYGFYDVENDETMIWMIKVLPGDTVTFWANFKGNAVGNATEVVFFFSQNSKWYMGGNDYNNLTCYVNVTKITGIGGLMEGSFSGKLLSFIPYNTNTNIGISQGKFSVIQIVDTKMVGKALKKAPKQLQQKYRHLM